MKNPLLQLTAWAAARLLQASAEWDPCPLPSRPCHPPPSEPLPIAPTHPHLDTHPPTPHHFPRITCTEISGSTMYSNLVWIMCCSLGFLKWYRSLYRTSAPAPTLSAGGRGKLGRRISLPGVDSSKLVFLSLLMFIFQSHILGEGGGGALFLFNTVKIKCWLL